jgi:hypothetical protein
MENAAHNHIPNQDPAWKYLQWLLCPHIRTPAMLSCICLILCLQPATTLKIQIHFNSKSCNLSLIMPWVVAFVADFAQIGVLPGSCALIYTSATLSCFYLSSCLQPANCLKVQIHFNSNFMQPFNDLARGRGFYCRLGVCVE